MILQLNKLMVSICEKDIWQLNRTKRFVMKNNNMVNEDIKGIEIDLNF